MFMKEWICTIAGLAGGFIAAIFGGWDSALVTLLIFMGADFLTGLVTAAMGKSKIGLMKKFCVLLMIVVTVRIDILLGTTYVRDAVCIAFCVNELLSILENTSLMGIPYPPALKNAIDVLQEKAGRMQENNKEENDNGNSET